MPSVSNLTGSNPGPNVDTLPDITQLPIGDIRAVGVFSLTLSPSAVSANTTAEQAFANTGLLLAVGDFVYVNKPSAQAGLGIVGCRVSAADTLAITFSNNTASGITPTASEAYLVFIARKTQSAGVAMTY